MISTITVTGSLDSKNGLYSISRIELCPIVGGCSRAKIVPLSDANDLPPCGDPQALFVG